MLLQMTFQALIAPVAAATIRQDQQWAALDRWRASSRHHWPIVSRELRVL